MNSRASISSLQKSLRKFSQARDWEKLHLPKNLAIGISVEAVELLERIQWETSSSRLSSRKRAEIQDESADIFIHLLRLSDKLDIDLLVAAEGKMAKNSRKYPAKKVFGGSKKYTEH